MAAVSCYMLPIIILYSSGQLGSDRFHRELAGITVQERAIKDFVAWLERVGIKRTTEIPIVDSMYALDAQPDARRPLFSPSLSVSCAGHEAVPQLSP